MKQLDLPQLPEGVEYFGADDGPEEVTYQQEGMTYTDLWARYKVHGLDVRIGWVIGHLMGNFREPNKLSIDFDASEYAMSYDPTGAAEQSKAFEGITTSVLRSIPLSHARALMRDRHEQLSVAQVKEDITPLPSRVETDRDYVHVASAYVALGPISVEPIKRLSEWSGESVDTWSARLRRARAKGILEGKGREARIAPAFEEQSNEIWTTMRARKDEE